MSKYVDYKKYISSKEWKEKKEEVFNQRGKECEQCGYQYRLHVHHLTYERLGNERLEDLQILCFQCHMSKHDEYFDKYVLKGKTPPKGWRALKDGEIRITREHLENLRTKKGGITKHVYKLFGFKRLPKTKGWFKNQIGQPIEEKKYQEAIELIRKWDESKSTVKPKNENKKLKHILCNDLRKVGIRTINGKSISYLSLSLIEPLHNAYCKSE